MDPDAVACCYHDCAFDDSEVPEDLDTPKVDELLAAQGITDDVYFAFLALVFGRALFPPSHKAWQSCVAIYGVAGTGKSVSLMTPGKELWRLACPGLDL